MADVVTVKKIMDGEGTVIVHLNSISDGTGETDVVKVAAADLCPIPVNMALEEIWYSTAGMAVRLEWDASPDQVIWLLPQDMSDHLDFRSFGGIRPFDAAAPNFVANVLLTTIGHSNGDTYSIVMKFRKSKGLPRADVDHGG